MLHLFSGFGTIPRGEDSVSHRFLLSEDADNPEHDGIKQLILNYRETDYCMRTE